MPAADKRDRISGLVAAEKARARANLDRLSQLSQRGVLGVIRSSFEGFSDHQGMLWASALTYTSSLSLVPILAVSLSAVKGLGGVERLRPVIERYLAVNSPQIADQILHFVGNVNARTLGAVGGASLLVTVILTLGTIEGALNTIFSVPQGRTWLRKFSDYLSVTFTVPLLLVAAAGLKNQLQGRMPELPGIAWAAATTPTWVSFTFLYLFFPNTRVRWRYAALGGLVAAILLEVGQWGYIRFQVGVANYRATYGALAAIPMLLTWIYMAWVIVIYGGELTAAAQGIGSSLGLDYRAPGFARVAALLAVFRASERMIRGSGSSPCTVRGLAEELGAPEPAVASVVAELKEAGILLESGDGPLTPERNQGLFLARDSETISLAEVLDVSEGTYANVVADARITAIVARLIASRRETLRALTVKDMALGELERLQGPPPRSEQ